MRQNRDHRRLSMLATQGSNSAHQRPNRMWEMNLDACLPPSIPPSRISLTTRAMVAAKAEATASFNTVSRSLRGIPSLSRDMAIIASPPAANGNLTLTSWRHSAMLPPQRPDTPDHATNNMSPSPAALNALARVSGFLSTLPIVRSLSRAVKPSRPVATLMNALDQGKASTTAPHPQIHGRTGRRRWLIRGLDPPRHQSFRTIR